VYRGRDGRGTAEVIPAGAEVTTTDPDVQNSSANRLKLVPVEWRGLTLGVSLLDLLDGAETVEQAGG
jgi:hypothetical protein